VNTACVTVERPRGFRRASRHSVPHHTVEDVRFTSV